MSATTTTRTRRAGDKEVVAARLAWLARARDEAEAHLVERALLAETDKDPGPAAAPGGSR